jgi:hypothetical protein
MPHGHCILYWGPGEIESIAKKLEIKNPAPEMEAGFFFFR